MVSIDMDMPNSCVDCHFRFSKTLEMIEGPKTTHMCTVTLKVIDNINKKADWCPLNEVTK